MVGVANCPLRGVIHYCSKHQNSRCMLLRDLNLCRYNPDIQDYLLCVAGVEESPLSGIPLFMDYHALYNKCMHE